MRASLAASLRGVIFLAVPASVGLMLLRQPLVALLYQRGEFDERSVQLVSWALLWYAGGLVGHSIMEILTRAFYQARHPYTGDHRYLRNAPEFDPEHHILPFTLNSLAGCHTVDWRLLIPWRQLWKPLLSSSLCGYRLNGMDGQRIFAQDSPRSCAASLWQQGFSPGCTGCQIN